MKSSMAWTLAGALALAMSGCQSDEAATTDGSPTNNAVDAAADASASPSAGSADLALLGGPVPRCPEMVTPARLAYRLAAIRSCELATTIQEKMNSTGCLAKDKMLGCMHGPETPDYSLEQFRAEETAALQP